MIVHRFNADGFYVKSHKARLDPEETKKQGEDIFLIPANSFIGELLPFGENEILKLAGNELSVFPNYTGQHYYEPGGKKVEITKPGIDIPEGSLQTDPKPYEDSHDGSVWIENTTRKEADQAETTRLAEHETEKAGFTKKTLSDKEQWAKDRLNETSLDNPSKIAIGKIFKRLIAFTD